ncbi:MAG: 16S rRNA (uracil(1498)-N(3))-methyltransferase [Betaproteobacteria bacterium]|nr:16S rRNA (uracil(1498)-N(3))-methyltransferase [Betaproteobacteria bacterium]
MTVRLHVDSPLAADAEMSLPPGAARHAQVRRVQPGDTLLLFDGAGADWPATVLAVGRSEVRVQVGRPQPVATELPRAVTLAVGMPANERMDTLVEKATELGVAAIQPLMTQRSVLRLAGERATRKQAHWQAIAVAACEQCGRARVPVVSPVRELADWLAHAPGELHGTTEGPGRHAPLRVMLSLQPDAVALPALPGTGTGCVFALSGPEGGLTPEEEAAARAAGFRPVALGPRVLRADTAPLALLAWLGIAQSHTSVG